MEIATLQRKSRGVGLLAQIPFFIFIRPNVFRLAPRPLGCSPSFICIYGSQVVVPKRDVQLNSMQPQGRNDDFSH